MVTEGHHRWAVRGYNQGIRLPGRAKEGPRRLQQKEGFHHLVLLERRAEPHHQQLRVDCRQIPPQVKLVVPVSMAETWRSIDGARLRQSLLRRAG